MKHLYFLILTLTLVCTTALSQVVTTGSWTAVGDVNLSIVTDDADNTDGVGDGAIYVDGQSAVVGQGVTRTFDGTMTLSESFTLNTYTYNRNASYVNFKVDLYNLTDATVLSTSSTISISNSGSAPVLTTLSYTAVSSDVGDVLQVRYIRTDDGNTARNLVIDNLKLNGTFVSTSLASTCPFTITPDLSLLTSNAAIESEISTAVGKFSDAYLGTTAPTTGQLSSAESSYNALSITIVGGEISGNAITSFNTVSFLKTLAQHLKFNPTDTIIEAKAKNTVWWVSKQFCSGSLPRDYQKYAYQNFARPASLLQDHLPQDVKDLFAYTLYVHSDDFAHLWIANYDSTYQAANGSIDTDLIYNLSDAMLAYSLWHDSADKRYQYMRAYKRFMNRFFSYTTGTTDGIKKDGSGFHHWTGYNNYMYAFNTASNLLSYLDSSRFQVDSANYKVFRDAVYVQYIQSNDYGLQALSTSGRNPQNRTRPISQSALMSLAISGGKILGLSTADSVLAGLYNRIYGVDTAFNYSTASSLSTHEGAYQFNHSHLNVFRKDSWIAVSKGFSDNMWGAETYSTRNRYGRYQSYGTLEIIYPGDKETDNGFDVSTWNWNYNPGATSIVLPWSELHAERERIDELQDKKFVGALAFKNKKSTLLENNHGTSGLFAMDFKEKEGLGWGTTYSTNNHNASFTFKKSTFTFDDFILCLASGINNDDNTNPTVTTLYQRKNTNSNNVLVNNSTQNGTSSYSGTTDNWVISKFNTGFYVVAGGGSLDVWNGNQQVPSYSQTNQTVSGNPIGSYSIGYINHGTSPSDSTYEYLVLPNTNATNMQALGTAMSGSDKPYTVHQKNASAHVIEHKAKKTWGYAIFNDNTAISNAGVITNVDKSSLIMYETNSSVNHFTMAVTNPDLGLSSRAYTGSIEKKIQITVNGDWRLKTTNSNIQIISSNATNTVIEFTTNDGLPVESDFLKNTHSPLLVTDNASIFKDSTASGNLLINDVVKNNASVTPQSGITTSKGGTFNISANGSYTYLPTSGFIGSDTIKYTVCDTFTTPNCATEVLVVDVVDITDPSDTTANTIIAKSDVMISYGNTIHTNLLNNDADPDGGILTFQGVEDPNSLGTYITNGTITTYGGVLTVSLDGTVSFAPASGVIGDVTYFTYEVCDNGSPQACSQEMLQVTVATSDTSGDNPPFAGDDFATTDQGSPVSGCLTCNDGDGDSNDALSINGITIDTSCTPGTAIQTMTTSAGGSLQIFCDGTYTYTPPSGFSGTDGATIEVCDTSAPVTCASSSINFLVSPVVRDYGDLPAAWGNRYVRYLDSTSSLARGILPVWLGSGISNEATSLQNSTATGDGLDDGLIIPPQLDSNSANTYKVIVNSSRSGVAVYFKLYIDWDNNGTFEDSYTGNGITGSPDTVDVAVNTPSGFTGGTVNYRVAVNTRASVLDEIVMNGGEIEDFQAITNSPVPVDFLFFTAEPVDLDAELVWATASENNNSHFEIERSFDGELFTYQDYVAGNNNSQSITRYTFTDKNVNAPVAYYRIKQVDFDGKYTYTKTNKVIWQSLASYRAYPNPVNNILTVNSDETIITELFDATSKTVYKSTVALSAHFIDIANYANGVYTLRISNGTQISYKKILIQK